MSLIGPTIIKKYINELSPLAWMRTIAPPITNATHHPFHHVKYPRIENKSSTTLTSPLARIHTSIARSKRNQHQSTTNQSPSHPHPHPHPTLLQSPCLEPLRFILVQTCLTRKTRRGPIGRLRDQPLSLSTLRSNSYNTKTGTLPPAAAPPPPRSDMLVALHPRTPLEKLIHRRAIRLQRWWRRMRQQLWYLRTRHVQTYLRMWRGKITRNGLMERNKKMKILIVRIQFKYIHCILKHWRKIYLARVMGVRIRINVYHRWLLTNVFNEWKTQWAIEKEKNSKTIFFFHRWTKNRLRWHAWKEWNDFIWLRKQCRNFCLRRNFHALKNYINTINYHKHKAIQKGRNILENASAVKIQNVYLEYANRLAEIAGNLTMSLEDLHRCATLIQTTLARKPQGFQRFQAFLCTRFVLEKILQKVNSKVVFRAKMGVNKSKLKFEMYRAERERTFLAECECMCLQTQHTWETSPQGKQDIAEAMQRMVEGSDFVCLLNKSQKILFIQEESLKRGRSKRKNDTMHRALREYRTIDPPLYACHFCAGAFAVLLDFNSHRCTHMVDDATGAAHSLACSEVDHGLNIQCQWSRVRLHEELAVVSANELFEALAVQKI